MEQQHTWKGELPNYKQVSPEMDDLPFQAREAINVLRGNIQMSGFNLKVIAVTSALANEGKSSISFRLAKSIAGLKKRVLYLDCDIRNSVTMSRYEIHDQVKGLTEYLCGTAAMNDIVYRTQDKYMDTIFTGAVAPNPSELISGKLFSLLLEEMRKRYDYIIVDTPPVNPVIDGALIAKQCDGTVLVVESGITDRMQALKAKRQLEYAGVKLLGVVLNKMHPSGKGYGYGYGYGYDYGEDGKKRKVKKEANS